jgi:ubiquinone/menaquinone biosynthesis C-methylase UbiE
VTTSSPKALVDVGCGPGLSTFAFSPHFDRIIGIDPSENMVNAARSILKEREISREIEDGGKFSFEKGKVDELGKIEGIQEGSVDLIVAGKSYLVI